jgi:hypothetical protein
MATIGAEVLTVPTADDTSAGRRELPILPHGEFRRRCRKRGELA